MKLIKQIISDLLKRRILDASLFILTLIPVIVKAQQEPMNTQYMFNTQTINPAYAGSWESLGFLATTRLQWVGIENAPTTSTLSFQSPTRNLKFGYGLNITHDKVGFENRISLFGDYSYALYFNNQTTLRLGLKAGFTNYMNNLNAYTLYPQDANDPMFVGSIHQKYLPNFGVGFFLSNPKYYIGLSSPKLINNKIEDSSINYSAHAEFQHFFLIAGYVFDISDDIKFKPTLLTKATRGAPVQVDVSANFLLKETFWLGAMYRTGDAIGIIAQWHFLDKLKLGYAFDYSLSKFSGMHFNTHELMVSFELRIVKQNITSPRYF